MGLFSKKTPMGDIRAIHYEGLRGFAQNGACFISIEPDRLIFKSVKPEAEAALPRPQLLGIDMMQEKDFMARYQGHADTTAKSGAKMYVVIRYTASDGADSNLVLWYAASEVKTGDKFRALANEFQPAPTSYTL